MNSGYQNNAYHYSSVPPGNAAVRDIELFVSHNFSKTLVGSAGHHASHDTAKSGKSPRDVTGTDTFVLP